jgi:hypothetical protein
LIYRRVAAVSGFERHIDYVFSAKIIEGFPADLFRMEEVSFH